MTIIIITESKQLCLPGSSRLSYLELITTWSLPRETIYQQTAKSVISKKYAIKTALQVQHYHLYKKYDKRLWHPYIIVITR